MYFCVWVTISLNCDVISLSETGPRGAEGRMILSRGLLGAVFGVLRCASLNSVINRAHGLITVTKCPWTLNLWKSWRQLILAHIETVVNQLQITYIFKYDVVVVVFLFPANTAICRYNVRQKDIAGGHQRNRIAHRAGGRNYYKLSLIRGWDEDLSGRVCLNSSQ